jgi:hypothetical protein
MLPEGNRWPAMQASAMGNQSRVDRLPAMPRFMQAIFNWAASVPGTGAADHDHSAGPGVKCVVSCLDSHARAVAGEFLS